MELRPVAITPGNGRHERAAIIAFRQHERAFRGHDIIAVHKIKGFAFRLETRGQRREGLREAHGVPAHVRHLELRRTLKTHHPPRENTEPGHTPAFLRVLEQRLQPEAHAKKRPVRGNPVAHRGVETGRLQCGHAIAQRSHARQDETGGARRSQLRRRAHDAHGAAHGLDGLGDAAEIADAVVDDGEHGP